MTRKMMDKYLDEMGIPKEERQQFYDIGDNIDELTSVTDLLSNFDECTFLTTLSIAIEDFADKNDTHYKEVLTKLILMVELGQALR